MVPEDVGGRGAKMTCGGERETARRKAMRPVSVQGGRAYNRCCGSGETCKVLDEIRSQDAFPSRDEKITLWWRKRRRGWRCTHASTNMSGRVPPLSPRPQRPQSHLRLRPSLHAGGVSAIMLHCVKSSKTTLDHRSRPEPLIQGESRVTFD
jgi:hypothetical protein